MTEHIPWPKIRQYKDVEREIAKQPVRYFAKVKLDGTNAAIRVTKDGYVAQSRKRDVTPEDDNYGFAAWARDSGFGGYCADHFVPGTVVYGEWCGPGIQKGVAAAEVSERFFAVFAIVGGHAAYPHIEGYDIYMLLEDCPARVHVVPELRADLDFSHQGAAASIAEINDLVAKVEKCDPFIRAEFGVEGIGEGVVMYPEGVQTMEDLARLMWKAKGSRHREVRQEAPVVPKLSIWTGKAADLATEARLEKIAAELGEFDRTKIGDFAKALTQDVKEECADELAHDRKQVLKAVGAHAVQWYKSRLA